MQHIKLTDIGSTPALWEGELEVVLTNTAEPTPIYASNAGAKASIGVPMQWKADTFFKGDWHPPTGNYRFYLVRLAFSLWTHGSNQLLSADFTLTLHAQKEKKGIVYDVYPREQLHDQAQPAQLTLAPSLKFGVIEASVGSAGVTIDLGKVTPIIRTEGLLESTFIWHYQVHRKFPLEGSRDMYAIVALPPGMDRVQATIKLEALQESRFGILRLTPPTSVQEGWRWAIGEH